MASDWFRIQKTGSGTEDDPYRPDLDAFDIDGFAGQEDDATGSSPVMVVKVYGTETVLQNVADSSQATRLSSVPKNALDAITGQTRSGAEWDNAFSIGGV